MEKILVRTAVFDIEKKEDAIWYSFYREKGIDQARIVVNISLLRVDTVWWHAPTYKNVLHYRLQIFRK